MTSEQNNPVDWLIEIYQSEYCITLDELPELKTYPIGDFKGQPTPMPTLPPDILYGDLNGDGGIDTIDLFLMKGLVLKIQESTENMHVLADLNGDGFVDSMDLTLLKRYILRKISNFPVEEG